jgi:hypothetical protein
MRKVSVSDGLTRLIQDSAPREIDRLSMAFERSEVVGRQDREQLVVHG